MIARLACLWKHSCACHDSNTGSLGSKQACTVQQANFNGCTDPGAKELDSMLPHHFSAAGVPTNADECLEAVQSNLTGPVLFF